jgi:predicted nucleotidyltransferase/uncharacterized protein (UPF0332 family)
MVKEKHSSPKITGKIPKKIVVKKVKKLKIKKMEYPKITKEIDIAKDFASKVHQEFNTLIKSTVLFGSQTKGTQKSSSDIDIVIIVDDASVNWDMELVNWYRSKLSRLIASQKYSRELHINTIRLTTWWNDLMHGDPVILNILRNGQVLIDFGGFFEPLKSLLYQGKIHSTPEAVYIALQRAPRHLARSKISQMSSVEGVYWTMVDSAQAVLITLGKLAPSPEHIAGMLKENLVDNGLLKIEYIRWYRDIFALHKAITHGEINEMKGVEIDTWQERAEQFMKKMAEIIDKLIDVKKKEVSG